MKRTALFVASCSFLLPGAASAAEAKKPPAWRVHLARHLARPVVNTPTEVSRELDRERRSLRAGWLSWREDYRTHLDYLAALEAAEDAAQEAVSLSPVAEVASSPVPADTSGLNWDALAFCESSGNWHIDSTYDGGIQFHPGTWLNHGGGEYAPYAWMATKEQQIAIGVRTLAAEGVGAWPRCGYLLYT